MFNFFIDMHNSFDEAIVEFFNKLTDIKFFEIFFKLISYLGTEYLPILLFGILYWVIDKKAAKRIGIPAFFSMSINGFIKGAINRPRPFQQYPDKIICRDTSILSVDSDGNYISKDFGYGMSLRSNSTSFPSGHAQNSSSILNSFAFEYKKKIYFIIANVLCVLVMISRMALGVHFFTDVVTGYFIGVISIIAYNLIIKSIKNENRFNIILALVFLVLTFIYPIWSDESKDIFVVSGLIIGVVFGIIFDEKYVDFNHTKNIYKNILRIVIGLAIVFIIKVCFKLTYSWAFDEGTYIRDVFDMIRYFLMSFIGCGIYPILIKKCKFLND